jgi:hypothetical protein
VLDGGNAGTVLVLSCDKEVDFSVDGITLQNGVTDQDGGGLYAHADTIILTNNTITGNSADHDNGGCLYAHVQEAMDGKAAAAHLPVRLISKTRRLPCFANIT